MEGLTRFVLRHRWLVLVAWTIVFSVCGVASAQLSDLLTNRFTLPGTDTHRAERILEEQFGQRTTGAFTVVVRGEGDAEALVPQVRVAAERAAAELPTGQLVTVAAVSEDVVVAQIVSNLEPADSKGRTDDMREALGTIPGAEVFLTGQAAIEHDLDPVFAEDLLQGELIAVPIALLILIFTFGTLAFLLPFAFTIVTIPTTLGIIWVFANFMELTTYSTNLVTLIGLGIAIDYSLLDRVPLPRGAAPRTVPRRGAREHDGDGGPCGRLQRHRVALGLALLLFMPLPFIRGFGVGGLVIPAVSVLAAVTFLPALLSLVGKPLDRVRLLPKSWLEQRADPENGFGPVLARSIMRYPKLVAGTTSAFLLLLDPARPRARARPRLERGHPARSRGRPGTASIVDEAVGAGATAPSAIVVDTGKRRAAPRPGGRARSRGARPAAPGGSRGGGGAVRRDAAARRRDRSLSERRGRRRERLRRPGEPRVRRSPARRDHPGAGFPEPRSCTPAAARPAGKDFIDLTYSWFPWLVLAVLVATFFLLMRAFRSSCCR